METFQGDIIVLSNTKKIFTGFCLHCLCFTIWSMEVNSNKASTLNSDSQHVT